VAAAATKVPAMARFRLRSVVAAAAQFMVCQLSSSPARDTGDSNLIPWPLFLPFNPGLLSFYLPPYPDLPLTHLVEYHYFSVTRSFRSTGLWQIESMDQASAAEVGAKLNYNISLIGGWYA
jgi:hypothetical protein